MDLIERLPVMILRPGVRLAAFTLILAALMMASVGAANAASPQRDAMFVQAAALGDEATVKDMLNEGTAADARQPKTHWTALMAASLGGHVAIASRLLEAGANVNAITPDGITALTIAAMADNDEMVKFLVSRGANVHLRDSKLGATALHYAISEKQRKAVNALLRAGADPNAKTNTGLTPLVIAIDLPSAELVWDLLMAKADPNLETPKGRPHVLAKAKGDKLSIQLLVRHGAK